MVVAYPATIYPDAFFPLATRVTLGKYFRSTLVWSEPARFVPRNELRIPPRNLTIKYADFSMARTCMEDGHERISTL